MNMVFGAFSMSEFAQQQVKNLIYGSTVDTIRESQLRELLIPVHKLDRQKAIHDSIEKTYQLRYEANCLEDEAREILTDTLCYEITGEELMKNGRKNI